MMTKQPVCAIFFQVIRISMALMIQKCILEKHSKHSKRQFISHFYFTKPAYQCALLKETFLVLAKSASIIM